MLNKVGVIGWPIEHSLSPAMHNAAFKALGMDDWFYDRMAIPPDIVKLSLRELRDHNFIGVNVTIPHKEAVMPFIKPDELARAVGAANTIDFRTNVGTNTDVVGFLRDLDTYEIPTSGHVVVLGAGGAARAVIYGLARRGAEISLVNRTPERAEALVKHMSTFNVSVTPRTFADVATGTIDLIVNTTPLGMQPNIEQNPWTEDVPFPEGITVYDTIYRPRDTRLMQLVRQRGGRAYNGMGMLVKQGAAAFKLWTGQDAPEDVMTQALETALNERP